MAATTKTLTPTNQTISIPAFTDKPDNRLQTDSTSKLADAVNALDSKISNVGDRVNVTISNATLTTEYTKVAEITLTQGSWLTFVQIDTLTDFEGRIALYDGDTINLFADNNVNMMGYFVIGSSKTFELKAKVNSGTKNLIADSRSTYIQAIRMK